MINMMKRSHMISILILICITAILIFGIAAAQGDSEHNEEEMEVLNALAGAFETQMQIGSFHSADGTTSALTEEEINALVEEYTAKVHRYYGSANGCYDYYPWLNEYYLRETLQNKVCQCLDGGVSNLTAEDIIFVNDHETEVKGTVSHWNKWIIREEAGEEGKYSDGLYHVTLPVDTFKIDVMMIKEADGWKVKEDYLQYSELSNENEAADPSQGYESYEEALAVADSLSGMHWKAEGE